MSDKFEFMLKRLKGTAPLVPGQTYKVSPVKNEDHLLDLLISDEKDENVLKIDDGHIAPRSKIGQLAGKKVKFVKVTDSFIGAKFYVFEAIPETELTETLD